jgi:hypothetical protein
LTKHFAGLLVATLLITGCADTIAKLTIVSTKTADFSQPHQRAASQASASDGRLWITILPLGGVPSMDKAINNLLEKYNGDYVTDAEVIEEGWTLLILSHGAITVRGDVWKAGQPATTPKSP